VAFYENQGNTFAALKNAGEVTANACGVAIADYDNDGDLDFYVNGAASGRSLFRNDTLAGARKWMQITLEGVQSNRSAIGALIRVKATINGQPVWQIREVLAHNSFQSQHDLRQHFGLNDATTIDSMVVRWPSGLEQAFTQLTPNQFYRLREGENIGLIVSVSEKNSVMPLRIQPNPAGREFRINGEQAIRSVEVYDSTGKAIPFRIELQENNAQLWLLGEAPAGVYTVRVWYKNGRTGAGQLMKI
ncbi:MAG: ASPIC/UnbV domain-containing protein, partial [Saprospiraceae bacterium]|nr:ASPIC/UnbV domain-containing protein [Saprospiraceae bacterium]